MISCSRSALFAAALLAAGHAAAAPPEAGAGYGATPVRGCKTDLSYLNQITGWQTSWPAEWTRIVAAPGDAAAQESAMMQWRAAPAALRADIEALRRGLRERRAAPKAVVARVEQQVRDLAAALAADHSAFVDGPAGDFSDKWRMLMKSEIAPAVAAYERFLRDDYLPKAPEKSALASLADDGRCFADAARWWTSLQMSSTEIEAAGERLLGATRGELLQLSTTREDLQAVLARLRKTPAREPIASDELIAISSAALSRADQALPDWFAAVPTIGLEVKPMPAHLQESSPAGFYQAANGDQNSAYVINTSRPADRRLMAEAIAFHEGVPGHHLFFGYPRRSASGDFNAGLAEGWAIYAEKLADEMGLYSTILDREGRLAKHLWAASRLIIEPRLHSGRWMRKDAIRFMRRTTALPEEEIAIEIDRYLAMPGQSLTYMLGADAIVGARERARAAFGADFDIKAFHQVVLEGGMRPLAEVDADVDAWIAAKGRQG